MVQIKTRSYIQAIQQVSPDYFRRSKRVTNKFLAKGGHVHQQKEGTNPVWTGRDNVVLKQGTHQEVIFQ